MIDGRTRITFFCRQDFANVSTEIARALRQHSKTYDAQVVSMAAHPYNYAIPHDIDLMTATPAAMLKASAFLEASSTVVWAEEPNVFGDAYSAYGHGSLLGSLLASSSRKRRLIFHAGIAYRDGAARYNSLDTQAFAGQLCSPDLLRVASPQARSVWAKPMTTDLENVDRLWKQRRAAGKIVVTHSPSSHAHKGTAMIRRVMARIEQACPNVVYRELGGPLGAHLSHAALMQARDEAVLHIDQYHPGIGGVGIAAFEAMTRGVVPLASTGRINDAAYSQWGIDRARFPVVPLVFDRQDKANDKQTERALVRILEGLAKLSLEQLEARGRAAAAWAHAHLSPAAFVDTWERQLEALAAARGPALRRAG